MTDRQDLIQLLHAVLEEARGIEERTRGTMAPTPIIMGLIDGVGPEGIFHEIVVPQSAQNTRSPQSLAR